MAVCAMAQTGVVWILRDAIVIYTPPVLRNRQWAVLTVDGNHCEPIATYSAHLRQAALTARVCSPPPSVLLFAVGIFPSIATSTNR